jgi:hypothetical protein
MTQEEKMEIVFNLLPISLQTKSKKLRNCLILVQSILLSEDESIYTSFITENIDLLKRANKIIEENNIKMENEIKLQDEINRLTLNN